MTAPADLETILSEALDRGGITHTLDGGVFYLGNVGLGIRVKPGVACEITIEGESAVRWLAAILAMNRA